MNHTSRRVLSTLALVALTAAGSGCAVMSPVQTDAAYQAADGVNLNLGQGLDARGLVIVGSTTAGGPGRLVGQLINDTDSPVEVSFTTMTGGGGAEAKTRIPAHSSADLTAEPVMFAATGKAGDLVNVAISAPGSGTSQIDVPILPATGIYASYAPTPSPTS